MAQQFGDFDFTNPFADFLEAEPRAAYFGLGGQGQSTPYGSSPRERQFFQGQFQNMYNQYMGGLGRELGEGKLPTQRFGEFLQDFPYSQQFQALPPSMRGAGVGQYAPQARFLYQ